MTKTAKKADKRKKLLTSSNIQNRTDRPVTPTADETHSYKTKTKVTFIIC